MPLAIKQIIDISLELDNSKFKMRTPPGFKKDLQFQMEVLKEHDAPGGAGQIVRGVHMRLHAGSHIDAPEHNVPGGRQVQDLPLETFTGDAVIADLRHLVPGGAITAGELDKAVRSSPSDARLLGLLGRIDVAAGMQTHVHAAHDLPCSFASIMLLEHLHLELQVLLETRGRSHAKFGIVELEADIEDVLDR